VRAQIGGVAVGKEEGGLRGAEHHDVVAIARQEVGRAAGPVAEQGDALASQELCLVLQGAEGVRPLGPPAEQPDREQGDAGRDSQGERDGDEEPSAQGPRGAPSAQGATAL
jgi:hypothetical protein